MQDNTNSPIILKKGDKGDKVQKLQNNLIKLGYSCEEEEKDAIFGIKTYNALIKFEKDNNLPIKAVFDQTLQTSMFNIMNIPFNQQKTYGDIKIGLFIKDGGFFITDWFDGDWLYVVRAKNTSISEKIANNYEKCYMNYNICYSDDSYNSLYQIAKQNDMDLSKISNFCESDNKNLISLCCIAAGLPQNVFYRDYNSGVIDTFISDCKYIKDFTILNSLTFLKEKDYLKRGDIIISNNYIGIILFSGNKVNQIASTEVIIKKQKVKNISQKRINVRYKPSLESDVATQIRPGTIFTIIEEKDGWGRLQSGYGWINLKFVEKL